ncbi:MAG: chitobiase/beta-hexosaminidase C-terminal domain-containing protein [Paramuribaculum sp.]|nr:chitobiase/beta-hexosaminidase C-terminal domain-containing protein [Paramuribaculum sp.]
MKKLLLSIISVVMTVMMAKADVVTFDFVNETYGLTRETENNGPYIDNGVKCANGNVTITLFKQEGKNGMRLWSDGLRFYKSSNSGMDISVPAGQTISKIEISVVSGAVFALADGYTGTYDNGTWSGSAESVKLNYTATANKAVKTVTVTFAGAPAVGQDLTEPEINMEDHNMISIYQAEESPVYYTIDGTDPLTNNAPAAGAKLYSKPFAITEACTVKAAAYEDGSFSAIASKKVYLNEVSSIAAFMSNGSPNTTLLNSPVTVLYKNGRYMWVKDAASYILIYNGSDIELPALTNGQNIATVTGSYKLQNNVIPEIIPSAIGEVSNGTAVAPQLTTVADLKAAKVADIINRYYKLENVDITAATAANNFTVAQGTESMTGYNQFNNANYYDLLEVPEGSGFTVEGFISCYNNNVQFVFSKIYGGTVKETVATPVISPVSGELNNGDKITITCATEGATIYYTTDGSNPAEGGIEYTGAITFSGEQMTIKAIAIKADMLDSDMATANYTLKVAGQTSAQFNFGENGNVAALASKTIEAGNGQEETDLNNLNDVTFSLSPMTVTLAKAEGSSAPRWWYTATIKNELRVYKKNTITVNLTKNGYKLTKVEFIKGTAAATNYQTLKLSATTNLGENGEWNNDTKTWTAPATGLVNQIVFTVDAENNARLCGINVTYVEDPNGQAGINSVATDNSNAPVEYYNLQGVRLNGTNLPAGIYIRRQGTEVKKVYVAH